MIKDKKHERVLEEVLTQAQDGLAFQGLTFSPLREPKVHRVFGIEKEMDLTNEDLRSIISQGWKKPTRVREDSNMGLT